MREAKDLHTTAAVLGMVGATLGAGKGLLLVGFSLLLGIGSMFAGMEGGGLAENAYLQLILVCDGVTVIAAAVGFWGAGLALTAGRAEDRAVYRLHKGTWLLFVAGSAMVVAAVAYITLTSIVVPGSPVTIGLVYYLSAFVPAAILMAAAAIMGMEVRRRRDTTLV